MEHLITIEEIFDELIKNRTFIGIEQFNAFTEGVRFAESLLLSKNLIILNSDNEKIENKC